MTRNRLLLLIVTAALKLAVLLSPAYGGQYRHFRKTVLKPARVQGRAQAGFPLRQAVANATGAVFYAAKTADNVTAYFRPGRIIGDILFTPFRHH